MIRRIRAGLQRLLAALHPARHDDAFDEELSAHLEMAVADHRRRGLSEDESRRAALIALGGAQRTRDLHRDTRGLPRLEMLLQDVRYALRNMRRNAGFSIVAVLILALGIGANALVFSIVNVVLLRPLPFVDPDRLVWIANDYEGNELAGLSGVTSRVATLEEWQRRTTSFEALTAYDAFFGYGSYKLAGAGEPERLVGVEVAQNFFDVLGIRMHAGRSFTAEEAQPSGPAAVIVSHGLWQRRFAGAPDIVGRQVIVNDAPATIVGVLPETFDFGAVFAPGVRVDLVEPLVFDVARRRGNTLAVIGRLKPGASVASSRSEMAAVMPQIMADHPDWGTGYGARITGIDEHVRAGSRPALLAMAAAVAMVLLIVCANLSNLMLSRGAARQREFAIRAALGAGRGRLVRQLLTETLVLAALGGALGFAAAAAGARTIASLPNLSIPLLRDVVVDVEAAAFTLIVASVAAVLAGLFPAFQLSRTGVQQTLKDGARGAGSGHGRLRAGLVVAEVALACVLLVGAGLLLRSFDRLLSVDLGFRPENAFAITIEAAQTVTDRGARRQFAAEAVRRVSALPGVAAVGLTDTLPLDRDRAWGIRLPGRTFTDAEGPVAHVRMVGSGYFAAMGIRIRSGRDFTESEGLEGPDLVIVNETMARRLWPGEAALGHEVIIADRPARIVGVVEDVRHSALERGAEMEMYLPIGRFTIRAAELVVRSHLPLDRLAPSLREALRPMDPSMPLADVTPLQALVDRAVSPRRLYTGLLASFAAAALVLACLGIFGVISYTVAQRRMEIGIRLALGATPSQVWGQVVRQALRLAMLGVAIGAAVSYVVSRGLSSLLFGVTATDAVTFGATAGILLLVCLLAASLPARRAASVDPLIALRTD